MVCACVLAQGCADSHQPLPIAEAPLFAGVGVDGSAATSDDGIVWRRAHIRASGEFVSLAAGSNVLVALTREGEIAASGDGRSWRVDTLPPAEEWTDVEYSGGRFLAVGFTWADGVIASFSDDGLSWRTVAGPPVRPSVLLPVGDTFYLHSWHLGDLPDTYGHIVRNDTFESVDPVDVSHAIRRADETFALGRAVVSTRDGQRWVQQGEPLPERYFALAFGNDRYVAAGFGNRVASSSNLREWVVSESLAMEDALFRDLAFGAGVFVAAGTEVMWSEDGAVWNRADGADGIREVVYVEFSTEARPAGGESCGPSDEICGDTYCDRCEGGVLIRCATIETGAGLPPC
ncbi:MAG: hypothetical protein AAGF12_17145 [Myxococcota bacterium]